MVTLGTLNIIELAMSVLGMLSAIIGAVESPGSGAAKKADALSSAKQVLAELPLPAWAKAIFGNDTVLGVLIDLLVSIANNKGLFGKSSAANAQAATTGDSAGNAAAPAPAATP